MYTFKLTPFNKTNKRYKFEAVETSVDSEFLKSQTANTFVEYTQGSEAAKAHVRTLETEELKAKLSLCMRIVLFGSTNKTAVTGTVLKKKLFLDNESTKEMMAVLAHLRCQAQKKFKAVFGFNLVAGTDPDTVQASTGWVLVNNISGPVNREAIVEASSEGDNELRGFLIVVLGLLMLEGFDTG